EAVKSSTVEILHGAGCDCRHGDAPTEPALPAWRIASPKPAEPRLRVQAPSDRQRDCRPLGTLQRNCRIGATQGGAPFWPGVEAPAIGVLSPFRFPTFRRF